MSHKPLLQYSWIIVLLIVSNLSGAVDSLNTSYIKTHSIKVEDIEETSCKEFIKYNFNNPSCYMANKSQYFNKLYFAIDSLKPERIKFVFLYADGICKSIKMGTKKINDSLYWANTDLQTEDDLILNNIYLAVDIKNHFLYYKWINPAGKNEPSLSDKNHLLPNTQFPDLKFKTINGKEISIEKDRIKVLNWWGTGCPPSRAEIPGLNELVKKYSGQKIDFIAIAGDNENVLKFLESNSFLYEQCYSDDESPLYFGAPTPRHLIIDRNNKIVFNLLGGSKDTFKQLETVIEQLLQKDKD